MSHLCLLPHGPAYAELQNLIPIAVCLVTIRQMLA